MTLRLVSVATLLAAARAGVQTAGVGGNSAHVSRGVEAAPSEAPGTTRGRRLQGALDLDICASGIVVTNDVGTVHDDQDETDGQHDHVDCTAVCCACRPGARHSSRIANP